MRSIVSVCDLPFSVFDILSWHQIQGAGVYLFIRRLESSKRKLLFVGESENVAESILEKRLNFDIALFHGANELLVHTLSSSAHDRKRIVAQIEALDRSVGIAI